ncbi:MAG: MFS transporter [Chloroflexi bacterium]|nr:MFS transporter [Chloroflexota bacterium]
MSSESNRTTLFVASCISLLTTSMIFTIRGDILGDLETAFHLTHEQMGQILSPAFWGFTISIFICGFLNDLIGMKSLHALSSVGFIGGVGLVLIAPEPEVAQVSSIFATTGTVMLFSGFLLMGLSQGVVEGVINPLIATMYSDKKAHKLNVLHAWWPGGLIIGGVIALLLTKAQVSWQLKLGTIMVPAVVYLGIVLTQKYPKTERVTSGVSTPEMVSQIFRPLFLILFVCMWATAAAELGPDQWFPSIMGDLTNIAGINFLIYTAGLMFVLRLFAGPITHFIKPPMLLLICAVLASIGLYWLGSLKPGTSVFMAFAAATVFGVGKTFFWPTMLAITSEQFPKGGSLAMCVMGGAGMLSIAFILPMMGQRFDSLGAGAALQSVAILPAVLIVVFGGLVFYYKAKGGYTVKSLGEKSAED